MMKCSTPTAPRVGRSWTFSKKWNPIQQSSTRKNNDENLSYQVITGKKSRQNKSIKKFTHALWTCNNDWEAMFL